MSADPTEELAPFEAFLEAHLGLSRASLHLGADLTLVLRDRARALRCPTLRAYLHELTRPEIARDELRAVARLVTVGETYFFREPHHIEAFVEIALPAHLAARGPHRPLRVLSAGCASGEEAYTLAIALQSAHPELGPGRATILGIDVNPAAIQKATAARFSPWALRAAPDDVRAHCFTFTRGGHDAELRAPLRALVTFEERNLVVDDPAFWRPGAFDVIFCRNVLMYLTPDTARAVVDRFTHALEPGGFLFLSSSETLRPAPAALEHAHTHGAFYYRRRDASAPPRGPTSDAPWFTSLQQASARVAEVAQKLALHAAHAGPVRKAPPPPRPVSAAVERVLDLIGGERFGEALAALRALPDHALADPRVELLLAVTLCHQGAWAEAERACARALEAGDRGGACYVLGLCREQSGDVVSAAQQYQAAARLDPTFAMPHLRLGLLAKRAADLRTARTELEHAAALLVSEHSERVVLFGGGFQRWALIGLCQAELRVRGARA